MTDRNTTMEESGNKEQPKEQVFAEEVEQSQVKADREKEAGKSSKEHHKPKKDKVQDKITELESSLVAMADKYLRLQAEFDNFRKRTLKEKTELIKSGGETVLSSVLPITDDFDRALLTMKDVPADDPAKIGFLLIFNKFKEFMKQNGVKEIDAQGAPFDVDLHYALTKIPAPSEEMKGKVVDVIEKGYLLNEKVLRYAKVVIGE